MNKARISKHFRV